MGVDPLSPIAPVRLRALLLPIGKIKRSRFLSFAARLQAENVVRLSDISPDARPNRSMLALSIPFLQQDRLVIDIMGTVVD